MAQVGDLALNRDPLPPQFATNPCRMNECGSENKTKKDGMAHHNRDAINDRQLEVLKMGSVSPLQFIKLLHVSRVS